MATQTSVAAKTNLQLNAGLHNVWRPRVVNETINKKMSLKIVATVILLLCVAANAYPVEHFKEGNTTVFAMQNLIYGGRFMVGLGMR